MSVFGSKSTSTLRCCVVICTRDRPECLERCLDAIARLDYSEFEVLIVDSAPSDTRSRDLVLRRKIRYVLESHPGANRARNCAVKETTADIVAFLDDDAVPQSDWLTHLCAEFQDESVVAVAGRTLAPPDQNHGYLWLDSGIDSRRITKDNPDWFDISNFGGIGIGANMALRRDVLGSWKGFEERLGRGTPLFGGDDSYTFYSLLDMGYAVVYTPHAIVWHPWRDRPIDMKAFYVKNLTASTAYITFLLMETPHRMRVIKYLLEAMLGRRRTWRNDDSVKPTVSRWQRIAALTLGPFICLQWVVSTRRQKVPTIAVEPTRVLSR